MCCLNGRNSLDTSSVICKIDDLCDEDILLLFNLRLLIGEWVGAVSIGYKFQGFVQMLSHGSTFLEDEA